MHSIHKAQFIDYAYLLFLSAIWGGSFLAIELALVSFNPFFVAFGRIFIAALFLLFLSIIQKKLFPNTKKQWVLLICAGILNSAIPFYLISWGQVYINGSTASLILSGGPFMALFLSHFITHDEKFTWLKLLGVLLGFCGIFVLLVDDIAMKDTMAIYGQVAVFLAVNCYVAAGLIIRRLNDIPVVTLSASMLSMASFAMMPLLFFIPFPDIDFYGTPWWSIVFLALVPTAFATLIRVQLVQRAGVQFMSQVAYLIPPFTLLWSWLIFHEIPPLQMWIALSLVLFGLFIRRLGS